MQRLSVLPIIHKDKLLGGRVSLFLLTARGEPSDGMGLIGGTIMTGKERVGYPLLRERTYFGFQHDMTHAVRKLMDLFVV